MVPFQAHIDLLDSFLAHRDDIVERIQGLLNAHRKPVEYLRDSSLLSRQFEDCFFTVPGITSSQSGRRGQLEAAHWAGGFKPREIAGLHNGPAEPAELMVRAFYLWQQTRWPGRNGRIRYAHTLFNLYVVRCLELLSMRLWDDGSTDAGDRLRLVQGALDRLWQLNTADQPVLVADARWLIQLAQSLATDDLGAYFTVAERIDTTLRAEDRIEIHRAGVRMTAGHLRSQIRYYSSKSGAALGDRDVILNTRTSNALDFALLIQELVPLLAAYEEACSTNDARKRHELADAICQGISPDPELFVNRVELLGAYSMIEHLFITTDDDGRAAYTPMGRRHVELLQQYAAGIGRVSHALHDDCVQFRPRPGVYSPYGALYGFSADLVKHMVLKTLQPDAVTRFGLEDVFVADDGGTEKLAWVNGWRKLPHLARDVQRTFEYPQQFAEEIFDRIERALRRRTSDDEAVAATGRLVIVPADRLTGDSAAAAIPELPARYIASSDTTLVAARRAVFQDEAQISSDRREGRCLLSYQEAAGPVAITKAILTEVLEAGHDVKIVGLPSAAASVLQLMCPTLIAAGP